MYVIQLFCSGETRINTNPNLIYTLTPFNKKKSRKEKKKAKKKMLAVGSRFFLGLSHGLLLQVSSSTESNHAHLQRPHPADPDFKLALNTFDVVQLDALPPASSGGLPPEEEKLLRHADSIAAHFVASNVAAQPSKCQTADDGLVRFASSVAPLVVVVETTISNC